MGAWLGPKAIHSFIYSYSFSKYSLSSSCGPGPVLAPRMQNWENRHSHSIREVTGGGGVKLTAPTSCPYLSRPSHPFSSLNSLLIPKPEQAGPHRYARLLNLHMPQT